MHVWYPCRCRICVVLPYPLVVHPLDSSQTLAHHRSDGYYSDGGGVKEVSERSYQYGSAMDSSVRAIFAAMD